MPVVKFADIAGLLANLNLLYPCLTPFIFTSIRAYYALMDMYKKNLAFGQETQGLKNIMIEI